MIRPQSLYPFPATAIAEAAGKPSCKAVTCVEMSMGQMVEDVEQAVKGRRPVSWFGQCGGDVPSPEDVLAHLKTLV
jgi:2-oxoglutarate ferredoxin oxidoreductase subunit alpha